MLTPADAVLDVVAIVKVGKTLGGSQLMNIANLPAVHYPFVLGIPRQMPCAPFTVEHQDALTDSLFLLLKLFVTQDLSMMAFSSFCKQLLREAMQDAGHLISTVAAICGCLATGRSSLALAGIFGAGKTTSMIVEPPNGTLRKGGITPLMLLRGTRLVGYEFKVRKF